MIQGGDESPSMAAVALAFLSVILGEAKDLLFEALKGHDFSRAENA
jgi:hypothetical protein